MFRREGLVAMAGKTVIMGGSGSGRCRPPEQQQPCGYGDRSFCQTPPAPGHASLVSSEAELSALSSSRFRYIEAVSQRTRTGDISHTVAVIWNVKGRAPLG